jgi:hypothetical protein
LVPPAPETAAPVPAPAKKTPNLVLAVVLGFVVLGLVCALVAGLVVWWGTRETDDLPPQTGVLVYEDDFENEDSGWDVYDEDDTDAGYRGGEYGLGVYETDYMTWANPSQDLPANLDMEIETRHVAGPLDNNFGILARYQADDDAFYWFQISSDGYFSVDLKQGQEWTTLVPWEESTAINQGEGSINHLRLVCDGDWFSFEVNGTHLTDVADSTLGVGTIGLAVGTFDEPGAVIYFDNLTVRSLQE